MEVPYRLAMLLSLTPVITPRSLNRVSFACTFSAWAPLRAYLDRGLYEGLYGSRVWNKVPCLRAAQGCGVHFATAVPSRALR